MKNRAEEFKIDGKSFVYLDFSGISTDADAAGAIALMKPVIASYPENSLYTIADIGGLRFDSGMKGILAEFMAHNKPYVKRGAVVGADGAKKIVCKELSGLSGRVGMVFAFTREGAVELLLEV